MKLSKKNQLKITGLIVVLLLAGVIFFFTYYQVDEVQVMEAAITQKSRLKKWFSEDRWHRTLFWLP